MSFNPPTQYADDRNLRARQALWQHQEPYFDLVAWVLEVAGVEPGQRVLDVGCGNGTYLRALAARGVDAVGCDLSPGMLRAALPHRRLVNADVVALPMPDAMFDVVVAPHVLHHVEDRPTAAAELRRVTRPGGRCVVVTNGQTHLQALRALIVAAATTGGKPWETRDAATHAFSLENGGTVLESVFGSVTCIRTDAAPVVLRDANLAAGYVESIADHYQGEVARPWSAIVDDVRTAVAAVIARDGRFVVHGDTGAFVCTPT